MAPFAPPPFVARAPWFGGDLQTLANFLGRRLGFGATPLDRWPEEQVKLAMADDSGDRLVAAINRPARATRPTVVLVHGLTGCQDSLYMHASAAHHLAAGHPVVRLNLRGAGPSRAHCTQQYHAGRIDDLDWALSALPAELTDGGVLMVGYSLGGNALLRLLGSRQTMVPILAAAAVSTPIDLDQASRRMHHRRNRLYHDFMLSRLVIDAGAPGAVLNADERRVLADVASIREFDDRFVARLNGFAGAADYYARASALPVLTEIGVPTLVIHAENDPWVPMDAYSAVDWDGAPALTLALASGGGHVGFHGRGRPGAWHDRSIGAFFAHCLGSVR